MGKIVIPSTLTELPGVQKTVLDEAEAQGFSSEALFAIRLSLDEAVTNAIHHGNESDPEKNVTITYGFEGDALTIDVADEGPGFCPKNIPDPTLEENLCSPNGRGVMLIEAYMSEVRYNDKGNQITMVKRKDCKLPARD